MVNVNTAFPSNYLKAADLQGRDVKCIIDRVQMEDIGSDHKPVVYFQGKEKGLVLNKTNAFTISDVYGAETEEWYGKAVILFATKTDFQGKRVDAIRLRTVRDNTPPPRQVTPQNDGSYDDLGDEIPF